MTDDVTAGVRPFVALPALQRVAAASLATAQPAANAITIGLERICAVFTRL